MKIDKNVKKDEFIGRKIERLYEMLQDPKLEVGPGDNGGIRFETEYSAMTLEEDDLWCEHKSAHDETEDFHGPTPDHPDTTRHFTWCDDCDEEIEPEEPDYE